MSGMEDTVQPVVVNTFRGLNTKLSKMAISNRESQALQNIVLTEESCDCRKGTDLFSTTQIIQSGNKKGITGIYQAILGGVSYIVVIAGSKIYSMTQGGVLTDITGTAYITEGTNNLFSFASFRNASGTDFIIIANGIDAPLKWTGSGNVSSLAGVPGNFKYLLVRKNRLWGTVGDILYNSALLDAETYDTLNWIARFKTPGSTTSDITGIIEFGDHVFVGKEDGIFLVSGENLSSGSGFVQQVLSGDGPAGGYALYEVFSRRYGHIIVFWNKDLELKGFNGTKDLIHLSDPIDSPRTLKVYNKSRAKYSSATIYKGMSQLLLTATSNPSGSTHDRVVGYDFIIDGYPQLTQSPESSCLIHSGFTANYLATANINSEETLLIGTYDGWVLKANVGITDIVLANDIEASPNGCSRSSNVSTITTKAPHGYSTGDSIIISGTSLATGSGSFDGTFTVTGTPTATTFTYAQVAANATGGGGLSKKTAYVSAFWKSKDYDYGNPAHQKQINEFAVVTNSLQSGQLKVTASVQANLVQGSQTVAIDPGGSIFGQTQFGLGVFGGGGASYNTILFDTGGIESLSGRYINFKFENVNGYQFVIEDFISGVTDQGFQTQAVVS